jgi:chemotaxis methyl-accepting protein methylase/GAF domain-containing protein/PAS domain-containing protein
MTADKPPKCRSSGSRRPTSGRHSPRACPIVGVGASAGGLEAFSQLLEHLPADTGMAFVFVQHLDPQHASLLTELLARKSRMPVTQVTDETAVAANHVYVIPPNTDLVIEAGRLRLSARSEPAGRHLPIDGFLQSLADERGERAIGVILSGAASDGSRGLAAIKSAGGVTFAQDPGSAKYPSMPQSAIAAQVVDFVLSPRAIARELARIGRHPYVAKRKATEVPRGLPEHDAGMLNVIFEILREAFGVDFTDYKFPTIRRRVGRRMLLHTIDDLDEYVTLLRSDPDEVDALYHDILIRVTEFFRDPDSYAALRAEVLPAIVRARGPDSPIRVWVPGCATGEEAYSLAISLLDVIAEEEARRSLKVFATDINERDLERARAGVYPETIGSSVAPDLLRRYFVSVNGNYQVSKAVREMCVFARHDLTKDPPFSRLDLVSCRNVLIYLGPALQKRVVPLLHHALRPDGYLVLGSSETVGKFGELFATVDRKHKIYARKASPSPVFPGFAYPAPAPAEVSAGLPPPPSRPEPPARPDRAGLQELADSIVLGHFAPASVVVDAALDVVQFRGDTEPFVQHPPGRASLNLLQMARGGLVVELRGAVAEAKRTSAVVTRERVAHVVGERMILLDVHVVPISPTAGQTYYLVVFEQAPGGAGDGSAAAGRGAGDGSAAAGRAAVPTTTGEVAQLREKLSGTRRHLENVIEDTEATNEELRAANEEIQSSNEELQSINEELETAKEELQSTNEELVTVNEELQGRNTELGLVNDDLSNLLDSVTVPLIMIGRDLRIRRFAPGAERVLNIIPSDVGRPITDLHLKMDIPELQAMLVEVIETVTATAREVRDEAGRWYSLQVRPYKTADNRIDGAVVTLFDIDEIKRNLARVTEAGRLSEALNAMNVAISATLDADEIMRRVVVESCRALGAESSAIILNEGGAWVLRFAHGAIEDLMNTSFTDNRLVKAVAASREPIAVADVLTDPRSDKNLVIQHAIRSVLVMPLIRRDEVIGALFFNWHTQPVEHDDMPVALAYKLAVSVTLALDNALLYAERRQAEEMNAALNIVDVAMNSTRDFDSVVHTAVLSAARAMGSDGAAIALREGNDLVTRGVAGLPRDIVGARQRIDALKGVWSNLRRQEPVVIENAGHDDVIRPGLFGDTAIGSLVLTPLTARRKVIGLLAFTYRQPAAGSIDEPHTRFATKLAGSVSLALENSRLYKAEHETADVLRNLLVRPVPQVAGLQVATAHETALEVERVGGDFFDVFVVNERLTAVFIADVLGRGLKAAGFTEMVRSSVKALTYVDHSPAVVLSRVNEMLCRERDEERFATAILLVIDPATGKITSACAGHPPPVVCAGACAFMATSPGPPLGAFPGTYREIESTLEPGQAVVLYTDGVTEAKRGREMFGDDRLLAALAAMRSSDPEHLARELLGTVTRFASGGVHDDIAIVSFALASDGRPPSAVERTRPPRA